MNRVIKFRVWDNALKLFINNIGMKANNVLCDGTEQRFQVMQFTGLHDKNGKEIYEGDVIMRTDEKATIFYNQPMASFDFENEGGDCEPMVLTDGWHPEAHLVIGNIHQTPTT